MVYLSAFSACSRRGNFESLLVSGGVANQRRDPPLLLRHLLQINSWHRLEFQKMAITVSLMVMSPCDGHVDCGPLSRSARDGYSMKVVVGGLVIL